MVTTSPAANRIDMRIENLLAVAERFGYRLETDEWSEILLQRTIVFRQVRAGRGVSDTELRIEVRTSQQTGRRHVECRGWHHLDATNRGKKVAFSAAAMWLQGHAVIRD